MKGLLSILLIIGLCALQRIEAQGLVKYTYHDAARTKPKEMYQVKDTVSFTPHGVYYSYFLNGNIESKGKFVDGETVGIWEFYYETGAAKMRGIVRQNSNYGLWEYFYESGIKSMEGVIQGKSKEGDWKVYYESSELKEAGRYMDNKRSGFWRTYFEDGAIKGEIQYEEDKGRFTEYFRSGKKMAEGPKVGPKQTGHWRFYKEDGTLDNEGLYENGKKAGEWKYFYPSGKVYGIGTFTNDEPTGRWNYFYEDGRPSTSGEYLGGKRNGYWSTLNPNGSVKSEITYQAGSGEYKEYFPNGKLKVKGPVVDGKNHGKWLYYFEDGRKSGECDFAEGKGVYFGYYPSGSVQTKGLIENDRRVGTWELYEEDGLLAGYYKPLYEDQDLEKQITNLIARGKAVPPPVHVEPKRQWRFFSRVVGEYKSVIIEGNPVAMFLGHFPFGMEFYNQERLGHQVFFEGIRNPFFTADADVQLDKVFSRGFGAGIRQKLYTPGGLGLWYVGHQVRYQDLNHFVNINQPLPASATETRWHYNLMVGNRLMKNLGADGFTIDAFLAFGVGRRTLAIGTGYEGEFESLKSRTWFPSFQAGLNLGYSLSFARR